MSPRREVRLPVAPPCQPVGSLAPIEHATVTCVFCPRVLRLKAQPEELLGRLDDWTYVDMDGNWVIDSTPPLLREDPAAWWSQLFDRSPELYSTLKARFDLVGNPFVHHHVPGEYTDPEWGEQQKLRTPTCCNVPMYAGVRGWYCRHTRALFPYVAETEVAYADVMSEVRRLWQERPS